MAGGERSALTDEFWRGYRNASGLHHDDYDVVMKQADEMRAAVPLSEALKDSELHGLLVYHLATHPADLERLNKLLDLPETHSTEAFRSNQNVTPPVDELQSKKRFGSSGLKIHNKIFAMLVKGKLVVKLPKPRVDAIIASGDGEPYDPRHDGRLMKEWVSITSTSEEEWLLLAREAMEFVASKR
jgi:TfoX/Sxy family transcriptional regulator of competence genes